MYCSKLLTGLCRLSNAFKFTASGYVSVRVCRDPDQAAAISKKEGGGEEEWVSYLFAIEDTGIGIPMDKADKLFESFSQVDVSTTRRFGGTGKADDMNIGNTDILKLHLCRSWLDD